MSLYKTKVNVTKSTCGFFYKYIVSHNPHYIAIVIGYILAVAIAPFVNIVIPKYLIDELMGNRDVKVIIVLVLGIILGNLICSIIIRVLNECRIKYEDLFSREFDMLMSRKAMEMKFANTELEETIEAQKKAETGISWYSGGIQGLSNCIITILSALITLCGVVYIVFEVSVLIIIVASIAVAINTISVSKSNKAQQEVFEKTPAINKFYYYIYQSITERKYAKDIRLYDGTDIVENKSMDNAADLNVMDNECAVKQSKWGVFGGIASSLSYGVSYCCLGVMAIKGQISISEFVLCVTALETFTNSCLTPIIKNVQDLVMKCNFMSAFIDYMKLDNEELSGDVSIRSEEFESIEFSHVYFKYPESDLYVLEDITFEVKKGDRISLVGLNGAGKSTLVKLICRLYNVTSGEIRINNRNINEYRYADYIKIIAVVFQDFKLFSYSIDENIKIGNEAENYNSKYIYITSGIDRWINSLESKGNTLLYKDYDTEGVEPSGGQAQKLAIARVLHKNSPVVILDEPTSALDPIAEFEIYNKFNELVKNKTAFYISHRLSSCKFCDRIIVIDDKKIVETGSHVELMERKGVYAEMFKTQAQWYDDCEELLG